MEPSLRTTLGVKGFRPQVKTNDGKDKVYVFGAMNQVNGRLTTRLVKVVKDCKRKWGITKMKLMQMNFAKFLRQIGRAYPSEQHSRVVIIIDRATWHFGEPIREVLRELNHLELYELPSYSPQLNVIERFWRILRRRATHNRFFENMAELCQTLRNNLCYYQTRKSKILSLIECPKKRARNQAL
jgi:transposase